MKRYLLLSLCFFLGFWAKAQQPVIFVENQGQWDGGFLYRTMGVSSEFFLENNGYTVVVGDANNIEKIHESKEGKLIGEQTLYFHAYKMKWQNAQAPKAKQGSKPEPYYMNFYLGNQPERWKSRIYPMKVVDYQAIYPGIDVHFTATDFNPKLDYIVAPQANPDQIKMQYEGLDKIEIKNNKLLLHTSVGTVEELAPYAYQFVDGEKVEVPCQYYLVDEKTVGFKFPKSYNKNFSLTIDPEVVFASLTGSIPDNWGFTATYDLAGNLYGGGIVNGASYPTSLGAYQTTFAGGAAGTSMPCDVGISKFSADGTALLYSTYIGGSMNDYPHSMVVDNAGNLYVSGKTSSSNFPTVAGSYDVSHNGLFDIFVLRLNADGTNLLASTYVGGSDDDGLNVDDAFSAATTTLKFNYGDNARSEILRDSVGNIYVAAASQSTDFPITSTAVSASLTGTQNAVVFKLNANLNNLLWSTYLGGSTSDAAYVLAFSTDYSKLYVAGGTQSSDFMSSYTSLGLYSSYQGGTSDGYICRFQNSGSYALERVTFMGTSEYDQVYGIQVDKDNDVYVMGQTLGAFPVTPGVYSVANSRQFLMKLNPDLSTNIYSTVWGSGATTLPNIVPVAFLVDTCKHVYISGWGGSIAGGTMTGLPITSDAFQPTTDGNDFYFIVLSEDATSLLYATYFGASGKMEHVDGGTSRFNPAGEVYQAICASCGPGSSAFPATPGAWASTKGTSSTNCNLGVVKIAFNLGNVTANAIPLPSDKGCPPFDVTFDNLSINATDYIWDFGDGSPGSTAFEPSHTFTDVGVYTVRLIASNENGCIPIDTMYITITVSDNNVNPDFDYIITDSCFDFTTVFTNTSTSYSGDPFTTATYTWRFGDGSPDYSGVTPPPHNFPGPGTYTITLIMNDPLACVSPDSVQKVITFDPINVIAKFPGGDYCVNAGSVSFPNESTNGATYYWDFGDGSTSTDMNPTHTFPSTGTYFVTLVAYNSATCNQLDTMSQIINIYPKPTADFYFTPIIPQPNTPTTFVNTSAGATAYYWDFGDGSSTTEKDPVKQYNSSGTYNVCLSVTNQYGCKDTICKAVQAEVIPLLDIPTAFTPNGDGSNDILFPRGFAVQTMDLKIFNRWGVLVFESSSMSHGWDGNYKGVPQPMEAYAYILTATFLDGTKYQKQGNVTLIR